jgi:hypothetical protein
MSPFPPAARRAAALVLALALPAVAAAQAPASTGVNLNGAGADTRWDVSVNSGAFFDAFLVVSPPSPPWQPNSVSSAWISAEADGSVGTPSSYVYRMTFAAGLPGTTSLSFMCAVDNFFGGYYLNGALVSATGCGQQASYAFLGVQTITSGFVAGENVLEFRSTGDGTTDGLIVQVTGYGTQFSNVPEPGTVALTASGLILLAGLARRRRRA